MIRSNDGSGKRILLVESDVSLQGLFRAILEENGYEVRTETNGVDAVLAFFDIRHELSFVLMEIMVPGLNGFDAIRIMRKIAPHIPVVLMTGYYADGDAEATVARSLEAGADACLIKPFGIASLLGVVHDSVAT